MRVLVLGGTGMMGHKAFQVLSGRFDTWATMRSDDGPWRRLPMYRDQERALGGVEAGDLESVAGALDRVRPDAVLNCIGVTKQRAAAAGAATTIRINSVFPHQLADVCRAAGARLLHLSTDCVFSGRRGGYTEVDEPDATDLYGRSKELGEPADPGCLTLRTSMIGRDFLKDDSLMEWFVANRGGSVKGHVNAVFSGLPTVVLARILGDVIAGHPDLSGVYHVASAPLDKYALLRRLRAAMDLDVEIEPYELPQAIDRSLDASRFHRATGIEPPGWDEMIAELVDDPTAYDEWKRSQVKEQG